jgi:hypothetical protein
MTTNRTDEVKVETLVLLLITHFNGKAALICDESKHYGKVIKPPSAKASMSGDEDTDKLLVDKLIDVVCEYYLDEKSSITVKQSFKQNKESVQYFPLAEKKFAVVVVEMKNPIKNADICYLPLMRLKKLNPNDSINIEGQGVKNITPAFVKAFTYIPLV